MNNLPEDCGDLSVLYPKQIHFNSGMSVLGMTMSDGKRVNGGFGTFDKTVDIPEGLRKIKFIFTKDEKQLHSIVLTGKNAAHIGMTDEYIEKHGLPDSAKAGRVELLLLEQDEELLGCQLHHNEWCTLGVTFILLKC